MNFLALSVALVSYCAAKIMFTSKLYAEKFRGIRPDPRFFIDETTKSIEDGKAITLSTHFGYHFHVSLGASEWSAVAPPGLTSWPTGILVNAIAVPKSLKDRTQILKAMNGKTSVLDHELAKLKAVPLHCGRRDYKSFLRIEDRNSMFHLFLCPYGGGLRFENHNPAETYTIYLHVVAASNIYNQHNQLLRLISSFLEVDGDFLLKTYWNPLSGLSDPVVRSAVPSSSLWYQFDHEERRVFRFTRNKNGVIIKSPIPRELEPHLEYMTEY